MCCKQTKTYIRNDREVTTILRKLVIYIHLKDTHKDENVAKRPPHGEKLAKMPYIKTKKT